MPIYFRNTPVTMPFMFDSVGNHWYQESMQRPNGHPHYHYLQTEKGRGRIEIRGKHYILEEQEGILIAPSVPHSYTKESEEWDTVFRHIYRHTLFRDLFDPSESVGCFCQ